ncbi:tRNA lysidine(34) synthetase TilS [Paenibacillus sp.]|uniref:tRNA lysidine(34) synthetase TilS n=1 Tax=Paenibacillus sp. TaxID=58172 RepID=UPI002D3D7C11|nr:tRNA lysidine(34) synthetase TilS [Paenibacillus sp.]HZG55791.1 tRNA lysidine(34) synthetase TilS [Paenibacillus sp.]
METDALAQRVERLIDERALFPDGARIVAAVSGGADSVALLDLLRSIGERRGYRIAVAHVNHGLRGEESDAEEAYVRALSERLGAPCYAARVDVRAALAAHGNNVQAAARALRLEAFRAAADAWNADATALAHHADDQAETVLMRLLRGAGAGGLAGIRFVSEVNGLKLVRPLLRIKKAELEAYCEARGLEPRFDSSNASRTYFRNVVRLDLLPYIMKLRDGAADAIRRTAELSADEDDLLDRLARERVEASARSEGGGIRLPRGALLEAHIALQRRMIKIILNSLATDESAIDFAKIERMREAAAAKAPTTLELRVDARTAFRRSYDMLEWAPFERAAFEPYSFVVAAERPGRLALPAVDGELEWRLSSAKPEDSEPADDALCVRYDAAAVEVPLTVRPRRPGDRIAAFGLNGTKSVKDIFVDGKLPRALRAAWPIVTDRAGRVLWVPGFRRSDAAPVTPDTETVLTLRWTAKGSIF